MPDLVGACQMIGEALGLSAAQVTYDDLTVHYVAVSTPDGIRYTENRVRVMELSPDTNPNPNLTLANPNPYQP